MIKLGEIIIVREPNNPDWGIYIMCEIPPGDSADDGCMDMIYGHRQVHNHWARANIGVLMQFTEGWL